MFAFVSNEYKTVVQTVSQLDFLCSIFSYPKFSKVANMTEARNFFAANDRNYISSIMSKTKYGKQNKVGYITVEYFIANNSIFCNVNTKHFGFIRLKEYPDNVAVQSGYSDMKLKFKNIVLDNRLIAHHCLAISNILKFFGNEVNIEIILPDVSVYLALTKYTGKNFIIKNLQSLINSRDGAVYYTVK